LPLGSLKSPFDQSDVLDTPLSSTFNQ